MILCDTGSLPRITGIEKDPNVPLLNVMSKKMILTPKSSPPKNIVSPPEDKSKNMSPSLSGMSHHRSPRSDGRKNRKSPGLEMNSPSLAATLKNGCVSPVRTTERISSANDLSRSSERKSAEEDKRRANLKSLREASSSANAKGRKFDVNVVTRAAVKTLRQNQRYTESALQRGASSSSSSGSSGNSPGKTRGTDLTVYTRVRGSGSGIPRPHSHSTTLKASLKTSMTAFSRKSCSNNDDSSGASSGSESIDGKCTPGSKTGVATDFQATCRARAMKKHKELMARASQENTALREHETRMQQSLRLKREEASVREKVRQRNRAEVYAVNAYLKEEEQKRFDAFLSAQKVDEAEEAARLEAELGSQGEIRDLRDDVSWCSADSSVMPTPRYRNERERNYAEDNKRRVESDSDSERSSLGGGDLPMGAALGGCEVVRLAGASKNFRASVGGGV